MDNVIADWLGTPQEIHEAEQRRRARLTLPEIYRTVTAENVMFSAELALGARKPLVLLRA